MTEPPKTPPSINESHKNEKIGTLAQSDPSFEHFLAEFPSSDNAKKARERLLKLQAEKESASKQDKTE
jgi:hypothetical protein